MGQGSAWEEERCGWELEGDAGLEEGEDLAREGAAQAPSTKGEEEAAAAGEEAGVAGEARVRSRASLPFVLPFLSLQCCSLARFFSRTRRTQWATKPGPGVINRG